MIFLVLGILMWWTAHLFKRVAPAQLGDKAKGLTALAVGASVVVIILGYRASPFIHIWGPPSVLVHLNNLMMLFALYFTSPGPKKGTLFYKMRHPMLTGIKIWATAHLLVNGDLASILLFGSMLAWAVVEVRVINASGPDWQPNPKGTWVKDAMFFAISILLIGVIGAIHGLVGPSPFPH